MAHGDYECCAVCDSKQSYSNDADAKEVLCSSCAVDLARLGVFVHGVDELKKWMESTDTRKVVDTLTAVGFRRCFYPNPVDDLFLKAAEPVVAGDGATPAQDDRVVEEPPHA